MVKLMGELKAKPKIMKFQGSKQKVLRMQKNTSCHKLFIN